MPAVRDELQVEGMILIGLLLCCRVKEHQFRYVKAVIHHLSLLSRCRDANLEQDDFLDAAKRAQARDQRVPIVGNTGIFQPEKDVMAQHVDFPLAQ